VRSAPALELGGFGPDGTDATVISGNPEQAATELFGSSMAKWPPSRARRGNSR
jgi:hypothetical protein